MSVFDSFNVLVPKEEYEKYWPVIACDQFTSQPEYWIKLRSEIGESPSSIHCIIPEAELSSATEDTYSAIRENMRRYVDRDVFREYRDAFVYVERTLSDGSVRPGIVGVIDLDEYDYHSGTDLPVRATERTVLERIPPRVKIRENALLELSHVILLCDDDRCSVIEPLRSEVADKLYDIDLLQGGGHVTGWLVDGEAAVRLKSRLEEYCRRQEARSGGMLFAIGDGNHSLAAAKAYYESIKNTGEDPVVVEHARYAMVELLNIYSLDQELEPIDRLLKNVDVEGVLSFIQGAYCEEQVDTGTDAGNDGHADQAEAACLDDGYTIEWVTGDSSGTIHLKREGEELPVHILQNALDEYLKDESGEIDYIHDEDALRSLADAENTIGFILPGISKDSFFKTIARDSALPRKTFSIGQAREKRYYIEARLLKK